MNTFFTADLHLDHFNIIKFCNRPFFSVDEMNDTIVENWNSRVKQNDIVYLLGDVIWGQNFTDFNKLNGKIHLIYGNHDRMSIIKKMKFESVRHYDEIEINKQRIVMFHYPMIDWNAKFHGSWHLYGHCHGTNKIKIEKSCDVGLDCWNYFPVSFDELKDLFNK